MFFFALAASKTARKMIWQKGTGEGKVPSKKGFLEFFLTCFDANMK